MGDINTADHKTVEIKDDCYTQVMIFFNPNKNTAIVYTDQSNVNS